MCVCVCIIPNIVGNAVDSMPIARRPLAPCFNLNPFQGPTCHSREEVPRKCQEDMASYALKDFKVVGFRISGSMG